MGNTSTDVLSEGAADQYAIFITATPINEDGRPAYCPSGVLSTGQSPSHFFVSNPVAEFGDEIAPTCALKQNGPGRLKPNSRMAVDMVHDNQSGGSSKSVRLMNGTLVQPSHIFGHGGAPEDSVSQLIFDDRYLLTKVTCFDKATYDPETKRYWLDPTELIFNKNGYPDCIDTPFGPRFPPGYRFGYSGTQFDEPAKGSALTVSRSWDVADIIIYIEHMYCAKHAAKRPFMPDGYGVNLISQNLNWLQNVESVIGGDRVVRHLLIQNFTVLKALSEVLRKAGPYELFCTPNGDSSDLQIANMGPSNTGAGGGSLLMLPDYLSGSDVGALLNTSNCVHTGYINESSINNFQETTRLGDPVCVERFLSTKASVDDVPGIEPAWDRGAGGPNPPITSDPVEGSDEWQFLNYISNDDLHVDSYEAFVRATQRWPDVFSVYRIRKDYNIWKNTKYEDFSIVDSHPRIRPRLLTGDDPQNPRGYKFKEIVLEGEYEADKWEAIDRRDSLTLDPDGRTFTIDSARDTSTAAHPTTWKSNPSDGQYRAMASDGTILMKPNHIRGTFAIEGSWRISGRDTTDPNKVNGRIGGEKYNHVSVDKELRHVEWLRNNSRPDGGYVADGTTSRVAPDPYPYGDRASEGGELFSDLYSGRIDRQAHIRQRDVNRVENSGQLVMQNMSAGFKPGDAVSVEGSNTIRTFSIVKSVSYDCENQVMVTDLASADLSKTYDTQQAQLLKSSVAEQPAGKNLNSGAMLGRPAADYKSGDTPNPYSTRDSSGAKTPRQNKAGQYVAGVTDPEDRARRFKAENEEE